MEGLGEKRAVNPPVWRSGAILAVMAAICTGLVALTYRATEARIAANDKALLEESLLPVLAGVAFDSDVVGSITIIEPPHELPGDEPVMVYRVFSGGTPAAALFVVTAPDGFAGPIRLLIGVRLDGKITGIRVLEHRETPGIGDRIDLDNSDWILRFAGTSLEAPPRELWAIESDGGVIDHWTGASVTPRAVVRAIKQTLLFFEANADSVFPTAQEEAGTP